MQIAYQGLATFIAKAASVAAQIILHKRLALLHTQIAIHIEKNQTSPAPAELLDFLVTAEDHRFFFHRGIDGISIIRAVVKTFTGNLQGGSSIEQQLVRTLTGDYRRCFSRKFKELLFAATLHSRFSKNEIAYAYLNLAYFGSGIYGWSDAVNQIYSKNLKPEPDFAFIVACLKYPLPRHRGDKRAAIRIIRTLHISSRRQAVKDWIPTRSGT